MSVASIPISLAGWGVRELSAVVALGAIGMSSAAAMTTAIGIGAGSLLAMGVIFALSLNDKSEGAPAAERKDIVAVDYARALYWILPLMAAVLVLFQVYLPVRSGLLNVDLADPIVILGASLFLLKAIGSKRLPAWRVGYVNFFALMATLVVALSLMIGEHRFGWTDWAVVNRFLGWFMLLAYAMTGALITSAGGQLGLRTLALSYLGAAIGVIAIDVALLY